MAIGLVALASALLARRRAAASGGAFAVLELADFTVDARRRRSRRPAVAVSNTLTTVVDTTLHLRLALVRLAGTSTVDGQDLGAVAALVAIRQGWQSSPYPSKYALSMRAAIRRRRPWLDGHSHPQ